MDGSLDVARRGNPYAPIDDCMRFAIVDGEVCTFADYGKHIIPRKDVRALIKWLQKAEAELREEER
jgi:hypothetical protein